MGRCHLCNCVFDFETLTDATHSESAGAAPVACAAFGRTFFSEIHPIYPLHNCIYYLLFTPVDPAAQKCD